jgi:UDP-2-acetamido-3-amino-2,3-dideoxy-glucuronate N-acetyltransferase
MVFTNVYNPRAAIERKHEYRETLVKKGATLGANCTIVCGTTIGEYAFVGAGAVITKDVPAYALMVGVPAKQIGWMSASGHRLDFGKYNIAVDPEDGSRYELKEGKVIRAD